MNLNRWTLFVTAALLASCSKKAPEIPVPEPTAIPMESAQSEMESSQAAVLLQELRAA